jgi:hypothetical protein
MKRLFDHLTIDLVAAGLMVGMVATGYLLRFPLPPGTNKSLTLWGLTRHQWGDVHFWISLALLGVILVHVVLHWQWVVPCHGPKKQRGDFRADRRDDFMRASTGAPLVVPGNSGASPLIAIMSGKKDIPRPDVHRLAADQVEILRAWIDAGAAWPERPSSPE